MSVTDRRRVTARRESLLGDEPGAFAVARFVRVTPMKARRVVEMVRGAQVDDALATLRFAPQAASETVYKVLESAVSNATTTEGLERGTLEGLRLHRLAAIISVLCSRLGDDLRPIVA